MPHVNRTAVFASLLSVCVVLAAVGGIAFGAAKKVGATGSSAPVGYDFESQAAIGLPNSFGSGMTVLKAKLPAGLFLVNARVNIGMSSSAGGGVMHGACEALLAGQTSIDDGAATAPITYTELDGEVSIPLVFSVRNFAARSVVLKCKAVQSGPGTAGQILVRGGGARLTAVTVGSIN